MNAGKAVYGILSANTGVTDIVGTRIFPEIAEQEAVTPFVIYQLQSVAPEDTHDGPSKLDEVRFEFLCYADSYNEAADLGVAVRGALDRVSGTYNGVNVESVQFNDVDVEIEYDPRRYSQVLKFTFRIKRDDIEIALGTPVTGAELGDLSDVDVTGVTNGQLIAYNSTTGNWEAADDASGGAVDSVNGQTGVVVIDMDDIDDVDAATPFGGDVLQWTGTAWEPSGKLNLLYSLLKEGTDTSIKNGGDTASELKLESTKATVSTGITKVVLTETSPGNIEFVVATDANGDTAFTALHLDGSSTANVADLLVKFGTYFKLEDGIYTQWIRPSSGTTQDTAIVLPSKSGVLGRAEDIPTSVTNLNDVTSAGSGAIITDAERTNLTTNTAKVGLIAGGTTGQALVKSTGTDYDVEWADIAVDVQYHQRYDTEAAALRSGATETVELYYTAQADGDGLSESASSDTPTSGYDIRRKLWYAEKAQADPDTSADWTQFTAIADNTTFNNAKAALLAYLKERTGGTVPISLKMTWEEVAQAPAFTGLLNESYGSGAEAAYSTRRLNGNVTECMVIRRASDSTTQTIGFDGSGNIDESAIETFCTGTTCTVVTWKDQSGNGNDATQSDPTKQPTIYTGGALVKESGKLALDFDGSNDWMSASGFGTGAERSVFNVLKGTADAASGYSNYWIFLQTAPSTIGNFVQIYSADFDASFNGNFLTNGLDISATVGLQNQSLTTLLKSTSASNLYKDGVSIGSGSGTQTLEDELSIGRFDTNYAPQLQQEFIVYNSDKSGTDQTSIEENIGDYFTQNTPLLDTYSGAAAAYSLRLLDSSYVGSAVEVYNGTSYADIGFNVFGELDTVALAAHCGSNDGFVSKWYDQSSNGNTAAQATTSAMPKIYDGTTGVLTVNGKPTIQDNNDAGLKSLTTSISSDSLHTSNEFTCIGVFQGDSNGRLYFGTTSSAFPSWAPRRFSYDLAFTPTQKTGGTSLIDTQTIGFLNRSGNNVASYLNNTAAISSTDTANITTATVTDFPIAQMRYGTFVQEYVIWNSDKLTDRTDIQDNLNNFYSAY